MDYETNEKAALSTDNASVEAEKAEYNGAVGVLEKELVESTDTLPDAAPVPDASIDTSTVDTPQETDGSSDGTGGNGGEPGDGDSGDGEPSGGESGRSGRSRRERKHREPLHVRSGFFAIFDPRGRGFGVQTLLFIAAFAVMLCVTVCLGLMALYFGTGPYKLELFSFYLENGKLLFLNILPFVLVGMFLWLVIERAWIAFLVDGAICIAYSFSEYFMLMARSDSIHAEDIIYIKEALIISSEGYITISWQMIFAVLLVLLGTLFTFFFVRGRVPDRFRIPNVIARIVLPLAVVGCSVYAYDRFYTDDELYAEFEVWGDLNEWIDVNTYISRGGMYPFIYSIKSAIPHEPEGYLPEAAEEILEGYVTDPIDEDKKVHVISIMLEAFCDLSDYTSLITEGDPYAEYHQLASEGYTGRLFTNIFAGGTIDTERCVLTGASELTSFRRTSWSYARYFAEQGYELVGSHPGYRDFYNRLNVNKNLGFSEYYFYENKYNSSKYMATDDVLLTSIEKLAREQMEAGSYVFSYNVTYQNHGPYGADVMYGDNVYVPEGTLSQYDYNVVNNYLNGIADTGKQLLELADSFRDDDEPVVLLLFGDHKPWLGDSSSTYSALGIPLFNGDEESARNNYETEYIIWANDAAKKKLGRDFSGEGPTVSPCFLMNLLFEQCGWEGPGYMKFSGEVMERTPIVSSVDWYAESGELVKWDELTDEAHSLISDMRKVQYYLQRDSGGKLPS